MVEIIKDWSTLKKLIFLKAAVLAGAVWRTVSGAIVSFATRRVKPLRSVIVDLEPIQSGSGDPSPDNVRSISGRTDSPVYRTGINLLQPGTSKSNNGIDYNVNSDGSIHVSGTATAASVYNFSTWSAFNLEILKKSGTYMTISGGTSDVNLRVQVRLASAPTTNVTIAEDTGNGATFTIPDSVVAYSVYVRVNNGKTVDDTIYPQLELGITANDYEPYTGTTYPVSWETEAGTVYGGSVDAVSGTLTVTDGYIAEYAGQPLPSTWISDRDVYVSGTYPTTGAQVVYKLATPQTYQLTPQQIQTLLGDNVVWSDAGDVTVTYSE